MKYFVFCMSSFYLSLGVLFYSVTVLAGYVFDHVQSYGGPTPMALDTALCLSVLGVVGALLSVCRIRDRVE